MNSVTVTFFLASLALGEVCCEIAHGEVHVRRDRSLPKMLTRVSLEADLPHTLAVR